MGTEIRSVLPGAKGGRRLIAKGYKGTFGHDGTDGEDMTAPQGDSGIKVLMLRGAELVTVVVAAATAALVTHHCWSTLCLAL